MADMALRALCPECQANKGWYVVSPKVMKCGSCGHEISVRRYLKLVADDFRRQIQDVCTAAHDSERGQGDV
jgi:uncharacterized protein (DUF983 family)